MYTRCKMNDSLTIVKPRLHDTPVVKLYNRFDNWLYRVNKHLTGYQTGCQTSLTNGLTTALNEQPLLVQPVVKSGCTTGLTTGCIHDTTGCQTPTTDLTAGCIVYTNIYPV